MDNLNLQEKIETVAGCEEGTASGAVVQKKSFSQKFKNSYFAHNFKRNWSYLLFLIPAVVVTLIFAYVPIYGLLIAFQDYMPGDSILSNTTIWVGFENFARFFKDYQFWSVMWNTFVLCILGFIVGFPLPIIVALLLNSTKNKRLSKILQTIFNGPHFISLVVLVGMLYLFFGRYGLAISGTALRVQSSSGYSYADVCNCYERFMLEGDFTYSGTGSFGFAFDYNDTESGYKMITLSPASRLMSLSFNKGATQITEMAVSLQTNTQYSFCYVQEGSVGILYLNGQAALTVRLYGCTGKNVKLFADNNNVYFSSLRLYT